MAYTSRFMKIMPKGAQAKTSAKYLKAGIFLSLDTFVFFTFVGNGRLLGRRFKT